MDVHYCYWIAIRYPGILFANKTINPILAKDWEKLRTSTVMAIYQLQLVISKWDYTFYKWGYKYL